MNAELIQLHPAKSVRKARQRKPLSVIKQAHLEADQAGGGTQDLSRFPVLKRLAYLAKTSRPRARSVTLGGVRFPLTHGLWACVVVCPRTRRRLVGTVTL